MLLERFPEVQSLGPEDKWRLIDELWSDLAQQVEGEAPNENIVELLEKRFSDYLVDPSQGHRRTTLLHDWRNISASGSSLSPRSGSRPVGGMDAIRGDPAGLGERFEVEVRAALFRAVERPEAAPIYAGEFRRLLLRRFDHGIFYCIHGSRIVVTAVFDLRQDTYFAASFASLLPFIPCVPRRL